MYANVDAGAVAFFLFVGSVLFACLPLLCLLAAMFFSLAVYVVTGYCNEHKILQLITGDIFNA